MKFEDQIRGKLGRFYDLEGPVEIGNLDFRFIAKYSQRNAKYILKKSNEFYAFENNEIILFRKHEGDFTSEAMDEVERFFKEHAESLVSIEGDHMSSSVTLIVETDMPVSPDIAKRIEKFKFYKSFMLGFKGWIHGGFMLINPLEKKGLSNKHSRKSLEKMLL